MGANRELIPTLIRDKATGRIEYHPLAEHKREFKLNPNPPNNIIALGALGNSQLVPCTNRNDGHLILKKMMVQRTGQCTILLHDNTRSIDLMNNPVHIDTIVGNGGLPALLPETMFVPAGSSIQVQFIDISGAPNVIEFAFSGAKIFHQNAPQDALRDFLGTKELLTFPYFLTPNVGVFVIPPNVGGAGVSVQFADISSDFDFEMMKINYVGTELMRYEIRHRGSSWSNDAETHSNVGTGTGQLPHIIENTLIKRGEKLELHFTNLSAINPNIVYFTMIGRGIVVH